MIEHAAQTSKNGKVPYGFVNKLVLESASEEPWINRNVINHAYKKFSEQKRSLTESVRAPVASSTETKPNAASGRPKGSTNIKKRHLKEVLLAAKNEIATSCLHEKRNAREKEQSYRMDGSITKLPK